MSIDIAYRSNAYEVVSLWSEWKKGYQEAWKVYREWAEKTAPGFEPFVTARHGGALMCAGLAFKNGGSRNGSPGGLWRLSERGTCWVANRRTKAGKALHAEIEALPQPRDPTERMPGMPGLVIGNGYWYRPMLGELGDYLYAAWSVDIEDPKERLNVFTKTQTVDPAIWQRIKLSEFYAAKEAAEAAE